jgi:hypothetical protein
MEERRLAIYGGGGGGKLETMGAKFAFDANRNKYMNQRNQVHVVYKFSCKQITAVILLPSNLSNYLCATFTLS